MPHAAVPHKEPTQIADGSRAHPLARSVAFADQVVKLLSFSILDDGEPDVLDDRHGPRIECAQALSDTSFFPRWKAQAAQCLATQHAVPDQLTVPDKTTDGHVLQWYLAIPAYLGAVLFHSSRRVPELAPRRLSFRLDCAISPSAAVSPSAAAQSAAAPSAVVHEVALRPGRFWCLPDDPDARHPDAVPVPDEATLGAVLRHEVIAHAARFLAVYDRHVRFGRRTQWATVTDVLDSGLLLAGRSFGSPQAGAADARLVLGAGEPPLTSASTICEVTDDQGRNHWTRRRGSCCFLYALPGIDRPCASCPRVNETDRVRIYGTLDPS